MLKITDDIKGLDMTFKMDDREIGVVASQISQEWFNIIQRLMEHEVKLLNVRLINTGTANPNEILANHAVAKGAGMFYSGFIQRLTQLVDDYLATTGNIGTITNPEKPPYQDEFTANPADEVS